MLLLNLVILPNQNKVYAADVATCPVFGNIPAGYHQAPFPDCMIVPTLTTPDATYTPPGPAASLSMTIDNQTNISEQKTASRNTTIYSPHTIAITASNIDSYTLTLSNVKITGPTALAGVSNTKGSAITNDKWGYAWGDTADADANMTYNSSISSNLAGAAVVNNAANFSRKLVFAAKFSDSASSGTYQLTATLSAVATPMAVAGETQYVSWNKMALMQDMSSYACADMSIGTSKTLTDVRDNSTYTIAKLSDGKCWMTQNLRLSRNTLKTELENVIDQYDTNTNSGYIVPASTTSFTNPDPATGRIRSSTDSDYGAYYSFNAATTGAGASQTSGNTEYDICPKGWRLPTGGNNGEFQTLYNKYSTPTGFATVNSKKGYWIGGASASTGGAFFPAAGFATNSSLSSAGSSGRYWSNATDDETSTYFLLLSSGSIQPASYGARYLGHSIRCIAK